MKVLIRSADVSLTAWRGRSTFDRIMAEVEGMTRVTSGRRKDCGRIDGELISLSTKAGWPEVVIVE